MQENPAFNREVRGRWRRPLTPLAFFAFTVALAVAGYFSWVEILRSNGDATAIDPHAGLDLLLGMAVVQIILASLFATGLTAPSISAEREAGTLLILRFAPVTMRTVVYGKFFAAVCLVFLLIFVPFPVISLTFVLGGVSAPEFCAVAAIQLASGIVCASIGTLCSAVSHTSSRALPSAFMLSLFTLPVPVRLVIAVGDQGFFVWFPFALVGAAVIALFCMETAVTRVENEPSETSSIAEPDFFLMPSEGLNVYSPRLGEEGYRTPVDGPPSAPGHAVSPDVAVPLRGTTLLTPVGRALTFANPVFQHQIRRHLGAIVRAPATELQARAIQLSAVCIGWLAWWVLTFFHPDVTASLEEVMPWMRVIGYGMVIFATASAATAFARERSGNMLTTLLLTPLSARDVAGAKRDAALIAAVFYFLAASPFFSFAFAIDPVTAANQALLFVALMALGSSLGVLSGWLCLSQGMAVALALIALLALHAAFGVVREFLSYGVQYHLGEVLQRPWGSFIVQIIQPSNVMESLQARLVLVTCILGVAALAMLPVLWGLRPKALGKDRTSWANRDLSKMV